MLNAEQGLKEICNSHIERDDECACDECNYLRPKRIFF